MKKGNDRVYISGAITGLDPARVAAHFRRAETELVVHNGFDPKQIINPYRIAAHLPEDMEHSEYMAVDMRLLELCGTIYLLNNWEGSPGANAEKEHAESLGLKIIYEAEEEGKRKVRR